MYLAIANIPTLWIFLFLKGKYYQNIHTGTWLQGNADAGEHVKSDIDKQTGLPIVSLYGNNKSQNQSRLVILISFYSIYRM